MTQLKVAIVGAGPSGFFVTERLLQSDTSIQIDIIERLPTPFGLVRYGVAPDHQTTKNVTSHFQSLLDHERVCFFGNVDVGRDISVEKLQGIYDAVVFATGASTDRNLDIPGLQLEGVYGAAQVVGWYNGHPDFAGAQPNVKARRMLIVGLGNVALDLARIFAKSADMLRESDMPTRAQDALALSEVREITVAGRKGPREAKFTNPELREIRHIDGLSLSVSGATQEELTDDDKLPRVVRRNLKTFAEYAAARQRCDRHLDFLFNVTPLAVEGNGRVETVTFESRKRDGEQRAETFARSFDLVVTAIGFKSEPIPGLSFDSKSCTIPNNAGEVEERLYVAGWAGTGPVGVIGTNKPHAFEVAKMIEALPVSSPAAGGRARLRKILSSSGCAFVDGKAWTRIDAWERANAQTPSPRTKLTTIADMLDMSTR